MVAGKTGEGVKLPALELVIGVGADGTDAEEGGGLQFGLEVVGAVKNKNTIKQSDCESQKTQMNPDERNKMNRHSL